MSVGRLPPWSTVAAIVLAGLVWYGLGRWDQGISEREAQHRQQVRQVLAAGAGYRAQMVTLRAAQDAAERRAARLSADLVRLGDSLRVVERSWVQVATAAQDGPLAPLLPRLRLRALDTDLFATDSSGVRHLAGLEVEARRSREVIPLLEQQVGLARRNVGILETALGLASQRADTAEARVVTLEGLLKEGQRLRQCRVAGILPCPSRTTSFLLGASAAAILLLAR